MLQPVSAPPVTRRMSIPPGPVGSIRVAASPGPYTDLFREGVAPILEDEGYTVEFEDFTELQQANVALQEESVDLNVDQHTAYMEAFNRDSGADLASLTPIPTVPAGLFSSKHTSLDDVKDGQTVSIPDDSSNTSRAYRMLVRAGWLTLKPGTDETQITGEDIDENPHNLDISASWNPALDAPASSSPFPVPIPTPNR